MASGNNRARNFANLVVEAKKGDSVKKRARQVSKDNEKRLRGRRRRKRKRKRAKVRSFEL